MRIFVFLLFVVIAAAGCCEKRYPQRPDSAYDREIRETELERYR